MKIDPKAIIGLVVLAIVVSTVIVVVYAYPQKDIQIIDYKIDRDNIQVNQSAVITINVENMKGGNYDDIKLVANATNPDWRQYLKIDKEQTQLSLGENKGARTGETKITLTALGKVSNKLEYTINVYLVSGGKFVDKKPFVVTLS